MYTMRSIRTGTIAVTAAGTVWAAVSVLNYSEQERWASTAGIAIPALLPLALDGLWIALATVAVIASLDGRAGIAARIGTAVSVLASSAVSGDAAYRRTASDTLAPTPEWDTIIVTACLPVISCIAMEVALAEVRRQVQASRGRRPPVPIPVPRMIRIVMSPVRTMREWRRTVLALTDTEMTLVPSTDAEPVPDTTVETVSVSDVRTVTRTRTARSIEELIQVGRTAIARIEERGEKPSRDKVMIEMRALGAGTSPARIGQVLKAIREGQDRG